MFNLSTFKWPSILQNLSDTFEMLKPLNQVFNERLLLMSVTSTSKLVIRVEVHRTARSKFMRFLVFSRVHTSVYAYLQYAWKQLK
jgi:hypothetical protein